MSNLKTGLPSCVALGWLALLATGPVIAVDAVSAGKSASEPIPPLYERFALSETTDAALAESSEVPDFQRHISPLLGRLGCNGRACHGSFQGQGGFQLSLFGYDFAEDFKALLEDGAGRVDLDDKAESLILTKPVDEDLHEGGKRYEHGGWEYWVLRRWIEAGAPFESEHVQKLARLEVIPSEIHFDGANQQRPLKALAHWEDGSIEDVTCLCRFSSNDSAVADINESGVVTSGEVGDTHVVVSYDNAVVPVQTLRPVSESFGENYPAVAANTEIDRLVIQKLSKLGIIPSEICSDEEFLRRASLDATGTLPSSQEIREFLDDVSPDKRSRKIDDLLSRAGYAAQWTTFLCDMTGNNEDQLRNFLPQNIDPSSHWYQWIYKRLVDNTPYDQIVEGIVTASSRLPDESYTDYCEVMSEICRDESGASFADRPGLVYYWARNNFRTAEERAIGFAYSFLGVRIQCAQCHKHPFDQWSKSDFENFEKLFEAVQARQNTMQADAKKEYAKLVSTLGVDEELKGNQLRREFADLLKKGKVVPMPELVVSQPRVPSAKDNKGRETPVPQAKLLGGDWVALTETDVRDSLMDWLRAPENPYFAKAIVNRVWAQYFGVGIVDPPDDLNLANAPSNAPLLDYLANGFQASGYDLKWLHREILNSDTYQRSWVPNETNVADKRNFSHSQLRRLSAEATYDAVRMALAKDQIAEQSRELHVPRAITKPGASARVNRQDDENYALQVFGRSIRESNCDCDRSSDPSLLQTVFLANDSAIHDWLSDPKTSWVSQVAENFEWTKPKVSAADERRTREFELIVDRFIKQKEEADQRIADAKASGNSKMVKAMTKRKSDLLARARMLAKKNGFQEQIDRLLAGEENGEAEQSKAGPMSLQQATWVAENAYLRTVSRKPNPEEMSAVIAFLQSDENPSTAVEGLIWSLINTKEFILNH